MNIRTALKTDVESILEIHKSAFPEEESSTIAELATNLLSEDIKPPIISFLAEHNNVAIGHVAYSPATIDNDENWLGYILAPLAVKPKHQKHGAGSKLINHGIKQLKEMSVNVLFVYGDPKYYSRFGFNTKTSKNYLAPYDLKYPFGWQAMVLNQWNNLQGPVKVSCVASLNKSELW